MMDIYFSIAVFLIGLGVGSFLNYSIEKLEKRDSFESSEKYPVVHIATALVFLFSFLHYFPFTGFMGVLEFIFTLIILSFLVFLFFYDLRHFIIPNEIIYPAIFITVAYLAVVGYFEGLSFVLGNVISAVGAFLFFLFIYYITKQKGMGFGDVRYSFFMGLFLGFPGILVGLFFSFLIGAIIGSGLIICGKKGRKSEVPFGPFLITGTLLAWFYGEEIMSLYLNFYV